MKFLKIHTILKPVIYIVLLVFVSFNSLAQEVVAERKITSKNNSEILVEIKITKNQLNGFGKIEESVPVGFTAKLEDKANSVYSFVDGKIKFLWMELPTTSSVLVSYKLIGIGVNLINITGNFSYLINDVSAKSEIITVAQLMPNQNNIANKIEDQIAPTNLVPTETIPVKNIINTSSEFSTNAIYKVQIGAYINTNWKQNYSKIKNLSSDKSGEFTRYFSGSFKTLLEAETHQKELAKLGFTQSFIVYFIENVRYTLPN